MTLHILREAEAETTGAIEWYEGVEPGLGIRFKNEVRTTLNWIEEHPQVPRIRANGYRRVNLKMFPYYVAYLEWAGSVWILAIAHGARRPEYWVGRKSQVE